MNLKNGDYMFYLCLKDTLRYSANYTSLRLQKFLSKSCYLEWNQLAVKKRIMGLTIVTSLNADSYPEFAQTLLHQEM